MKQIVRRKYRNVRRRPKKKNCWLEYEEYKKYLSPYPKETEVKKLVKSLNI